MGNIDLREYSGSSFVKLADVADGPVRVTIVGIVPGKYEKPDAIFDDGSRLSLNPINVRILRKAYGDTSDDLIGKEIELFEGEKLINGEPKPMVMVNPISPPTKKTKTKKAKETEADGKPWDDDFDDDFGPKPKGVL